MLKIGDKDTRQVKISNSNPLHNYFQRKVNDGMHKAGTEIMDLWEQAEEWSLDLEELLMGVAVNGKKFNAVFYVKIEEFLAVTLEKYGRGAVYHKKLTPLHKYLAKTEVDKPAKANIADVYENAGGPVLSEYDALAFVESRRDALLLLLELYGKVGQQRASYWLITRTA